MSFSFPINLLLLQSVARKIMVNFNWSFVRITKRAPMGAVWLLSDHQNVSFSQYVFQNGVVLLARSKLLRRTTINLLQLERFRTTLLFSVLTKTANLALEWRRQLKVSTLHWSPINTKYIQKRPRMGLNYWSHDVLHTQVANKHTSIETGL